MRSRREPRLEPLRLPSPRPAEEIPSGTTDYTLDKAETTGRWRYYESSPGLPARPVKQPTRSQWRVLAYERATSGARAQRGLSPGTQKVLLLTEGQRVRYGLEPGRDVVAAVSSFRHLSSSQITLSERPFREQFVNRGRRC